MNDQSSSAPFLEGDCKKVDCHLSVAVFCAQVCRGKQVMLSATSLAALICSGESVPEIAVFDRAGARPGRPSIEACKYQRFGKEVVREIFLRSFQCGVLVRPICAAGSETVRPLALCAGQIRCLTSVNQAPWKGLHGRRSSCFGFVTDILLGVAAYAVSGADTGRRIVRHKAIFFIISPPSVVIQYITTEGGDFGH